MLQTTQPGRTSTCIRCTKEAVVTSTAWYCRPITHRPTTMIMISFEALNKSFVGYDM